MGYGCFNARGIDPEVDPVTLNIDYASTTRDEFEELIQSGEIEEGLSFDVFSMEERDDEHFYFASTIVDAGVYLTKQGVRISRQFTIDSKEAAIPSDDRDQFLKAAFYVGEAGAYWQQEPYMGSNICLVIAPLFVFDRNHDVWMMNDDEYMSVRGMTIEAYREKAIANAVALKAFMLSWMEASSAVVSNRIISTGSGYMRNYEGFEKNLLSLEVATWKLAVTCMSEQDAQHLLPPYDCKPQASIAHPAVSIVV